MDWGTANYFMGAPLVTGFKSNEEEINIDDTISAPFLDTIMEITITQDDTGKIVYNGSLTDNTGTMTLIYDPANNIFDFEQIFVYKDIYNKIKIPGQEYVVGIAYISMPGVEVMEQCR